jgi:hypothetical protein
MKGRRRKKKKKKVSLLHSLTLSVSAENRGKEKEVRELKYKERK